MGVALQLYSAPWVVLLNAPVVSKLRRPAAERDQGPLINAAYWKFWNRNWRDAGKRCVNGCAKRQTVITNVNRSVYCEHNNVNKSCVNKR